MAGLDFFRFHEAGQTICQQGETGSYFFIIHKGNFDVLVESEPKAIKLKEKRASRESVLMLA